MTTTQDKVEWMRSRWNDAARNSLLYSIATSASDSEDQFIRSGFYDVERILKGLPAFDAEQDTALEIGCGIGRLLRGMNDHFSALYGIDISDEMIARGRAWLGDFPKNHALHHPRQHVARIPRPIDQPGIFAYYLPAYRRSRIDRAVSG